MGNIAPSGRGDRNPEEIAVIVPQQPKPLKVYEGKRHDNGVTVVVAVIDAAGNLKNARALPTRLDLRNHSPDGFEWGYGGSGPSQLALALCAHALDDGPRALRVYQHFKWQHVAKFPQAGWRLTDEQIVYDVRVLEGDHPQ